MTRNLAHSQGIKVLSAVLARAVGHPSITAGIAAAVFALSLIFIPFMGSEFIPRLDEGDISVQAGDLRASA